MRVLQFVTVLWPGLPGLWLRGEWSALFLATGFAALLNITVIATWGWTELLGRPLLYGAWGGTVSFWLVSGVIGLRQIHALQRECESNSSMDLFRAAQGEYLKGNWFESELALNRLLAQNPGDADAQLMLATLLRRTGHAGEAQTALRRLGALEGAGKWQLEISRQWQLLKGAGPDMARDVQLNDAPEVGLPSAA